MVEEWVPDPDMTQHNNVMRSDGEFITRRIRLIL